MDDSKTYWVETGMKPDWLDRFVSRALEREAGSLFDLFLILVWLLREIISAERRYRNRIKLEGMR